MITNRMPSPLSGPHSWAPQAGPATETAPGAHPLQQQDGGSLSAEALQPEAQISELLAALTQAFAPPQQQVDPITQLKQEIQKVEQQLQQAQLTGDERAVHSLGSQLQQLNAQLQQLLGQQSQATAPSAPLSAAPSGGAPVTASSPPSGNSSYRASPGGAAGASSSAPSSSGAPSTASAVDLDQIQGGTELGRKIAKDAQATATGSGGWCYKYVGETLRKFGINTSGGSAYMAADQLAAQKDKVKEVKVSPENFKKLPPGAIVVWDKGNGHEHGHISVALGNGKEASDVIRNQITNYGTKARVFLPKG